MTIQVVDISALGIVCAADSAITFEGKNRSGQESWKKLFGIDKLDAVIGYYGYAAVGNHDMPSWIAKCLRYPRARSLHEFALELADTLDKEWTCPPNRAGTGLHLTGMVQVGQAKVPSFYHIWNHNGVDGGYKTTGSGFQVSLDFQYSPSDLDRFLQSNWSQVYRNGALQPYNDLAQALYSFVHATWIKGLLQRPRSLEDWAWYYRFQLETVKLMYRYLTAGRHAPIGRNIKILTIDREGCIRELPAHRRRL